MKKRFLKLLLICSSLCFCLNVDLNAQDEKFTSPKKLQKDFKALKKIIEAHPDPFTHISEKDFNKKFDSIKLTLNTPLNALEFYKKAAFIVALLKDGHSSVYLPQFWMKRQRKKTGALPYEFYLTNDDNLYVLKSYREEGMPVRAKILKINGIGIDSFLRKIDPYISYELKNFRNTLIDDNLEKYLYLTFGFSENTEFEYASLDTAVIKVKNMPYKEWKKFRKNDRDEREKKIAKGEPYSYKKIGKGVGLINIYAFSVQNYKAYKFFLGKTFRSIQKDSIQSLIIDVRGNYGGWPKIASHLFHYISDSYFKTMAQSSTKVSYPYRNNLLDRMPFLRQHRSMIPKRRHFIDIRGILGNKIGSFIDEEAFFNEEPITERNEYKGDIYLLTNRDSYSAASSFASTFQCYQMGMIIGEETGGTKVFRANPIFEELYRTGLGVSMSTTKMFSACYNKEFEGIKPTIKYSPTIYQITSDLDTQLLFAQRVIKQVQIERQKK